MLLSLIRSHDFSSAIIYLCSSVFVVFCVLPIHEYAHAFVSTKLGDDTARLNGRLTIYPMAHIDLLGALMLVLVGFGWAKPVPVNMRNFKRPKLGMAITALAGPVSNLIMAFIYMLIFFTIGRFTLFSNTEISFFLSAIFKFIYFAIQINITLAVFNLLPIPPLDGSRILSLAIPNKFYYKIMQYERYIVIGLMLLLFLGAFTLPIEYISSFFAKALSKVASLPFRSYGKIMMTEFF